MRRMSEPFDLVVRGGHVVTADSLFTDDLGIRDGRIVQIGGAMTGERELDARGKTIFPGGVDMHVHLTNAELEDGTSAASWADDFESGSRAAAAGGITTVGNITFPRPNERAGALLARTEAEAEAKSIVDFVLHPVLVDPHAEALAEIATLAEEGFRSLKIFMILGDFDGRAGEFLDAMTVAAANGVLTLVHCEDNCIVSHATKRLLDAGRGDVSNFGASRPVSAEWAAVARAIGYAEAVGAPIYIVHLSSLEALEVARRARARGVPVFVETRPLYLYFTEERFAEPEGALYVGFPPLRGPADVAAMWHGLGAGAIQSCCTDHAAWTREEKLDPARTVADIPPGVADLETLMPLLWSEGVRKGRLTPQRFVEITSTNVAKLFGLFPQKGTIAVGSDADFAIWDTAATHVVRAAEAQSRSGYSLYEGWEVTGRPLTTVSRGEVVYADGRIAVEHGRGRRVRQLPTLATI
jgi:dihydropyrimidinase